MLARGVLGGMVTVGVLWLLAGPAQASPQDAGVQVALRAAGLYAGPIDGIVGPQTRAGIEAAQRGAGLRVTGALDTRTRWALGPLGRPLLGRRTMVPGDFGLDVSSVQFLLAREGFYRAGVDGWFGRHLETAVRAFQRSAGLSVDGVVGPATLRAVVGRERAEGSGAPPLRTYVVQPGDSLTAIAGRFGVTMESLARRNGLDPSRALLIGTRLAVPGPTPGSGPSSSGSAALDASPGDVRALLGVWAVRLGVSPDLVRALAWMESGYQPNVVSSVGARGVMQVMPDTRDFVEQVLVGHPIARSVDGDIEVGVLYLRHLLGQFGGNTSLALGAWYEGAAAVRRYGLYAVAKPFVADVLALEARM